MAVLWDSAGLVPETCSRTESISSCHIIVTVIVWMNDG